MVVGKDILDVAICSVQRFIQKIVWEAGGDEADQ